MKKTALCILLSLWLILGQASTAFAEETNTKSSQKNSVMPTSVQANLNRDCLINELGKKGFTIDSSPLDTKNDSRQLIPINSIGDIDKLSKELESLNNAKPDIKPSVYKKNDASNKLFGTASAGKDVMLHVDGYYRVGVVIGGLPTYITTSGSWDITTDINKYI